MTDWSVIVLIHGLHQADSRGRNQARHEMDHPGARWSVSIEGRMGGMRPGWRTVLRGQPANPCEAVDTGSGPRQKANLVCGCWETSPSGSRGSAQASGRCRRTTLQPNRNTFTKGSTGRGQCLQLPRWRVIRRAQCGLGAQILNRLPRPQPAAEARAEASLPASARRTFLEDVALMRMEARLERRRTS
jgi:hypothetical protein